MGLNPGPTDVTGSLSWSSAGPEIHPKIHRKGVNINISLPQSPMEEPGRSQPPMWRAQWTHIKVFKWDLSSLENPSPTVSAEDLGNLVSPGECDILKVTQKDTDTTIAGTSISGSESSLNHWESWPYLLK